ncbi:hypothetical protein PENSUB_12560 [Penicillium subrubescens]|uniref:Uncharacterized protein n=1 Tax=Penicillium subrubescens TaxID=1316194 RepID=A0A1Q5SY63_9EURO|nr:hypothetical protein PENSUB_12560 [Penicillium subrubescens]
MQNLSKGFGKVHPHTVIHRQNKRPSHFIFKDRIYRDSAEIFLELKFIENTLGLFLGQLMKLRNPLVQSTS